jgi:hypothetical protein
MSWRVTIARVDSRGPRGRLTGQGRLGASGIGASAPKPRERVILCSHPRPSPGAGWRLNSVRASGPVNAINLGFSHPNDNSVPNHR